MWYMYINGGGGGEGGDRGVEGEGGDREVGGAGDGDSFSVEEYGFDKRGIGFISEGD